MKLEMSASGPIPTAWAALGDRLERWSRPARHGALAAGTVFAILIGVGALPLAVDAHAYWAAAPEDPYRDARLADFDGYFYSPAFTQLLGPLHLLPWPLFGGLWTLLSVVVLALLSSRWLPLVMLTPPVVIELAVGNIHLLIAASIVVGMRWPAAWALPLLTKVTPGIGLLWFAVRREWLHVAVALLSTLAVAGVSFLIAPDLWTQWLAVLTTTTSGSAGEEAIATWVPLPVRIVAAGLLVSWGGLTDRVWTLPVAAILAMPVIWPNSLAVAVALISLHARAPAPVGERT